MQCNATPSIITNRIKSSVSCIIHSCDPAIVIDRAQEHKGRGFHDFCGDTRVNRFQESPMSRLDHEAERENSFSSLVAHEYVPETRNRARFLFPPLYFRRPRDRDNFWMLSDGTIGCLQLLIFFYFRSLSILVILSLLFLINETNEYWDFVEFNWWIKWTLKTGRLKLMR